MIIFHSDLDNTLIYSHRHEIGPDKICVERYQNKDFAYMTRLSMEMLKQIFHKVIFIPTTTRTQSQYERIRLPIPQPQYALVCNGGILIKDGKPDDDWYLETRSIIDDAGHDLTTGGQILEKDVHRCFELQFINELFFYTKSNEPQETARKLRQSLDLNKIYIHIHNAKIYIMPRELTKGNALLRMKKRLGGSFTAAAGDAELDISMIKAADLGIAPAALKEIGGFHHNVHIIPDNEVFSDAILQYMMCIADN